VGNGPNQRGDHLSLPRRGGNIPAQGNALGEERPQIGKALKGRDKTRTKSMPQSLAKNLIHLIYSTKHRTPCLAPEVRSRLFAYKAGILKEWDSPALVIGGVADHVHLLFRLSKNHALVKVIEEVKQGSSKWLKTQGNEFCDFHWQAGYGAFSVSQSNVEQVKRYIEQQEEHHRTRTFQDELRALLKRHGIEYDERYVWD
jgi:REP element-mobilizing transposase RayT